MFPLASLLPLLLVVSLVNTLTHIRLPLRMPNITTQTNDEYLVTPVKVDYDDAYIVGYEPVASADTVHHILIYGCTAPARLNESYWNVGDMGGICDYKAGVNTILWAWALDAPKFDLPKGVGFHVGKNANINYILLQVHYKYKLSVPDASGVDVILTTVAPPQLAGIYLFATGGTEIPPNQIIHADTTCKYQSPSTITPFAYRTHTHKLGVRVSAWRERDASWTLLGSGDPQKPQMFYLMKGEKHPIRRGDTLHARCVFDGSGRNTTTRIGSTGKDEMCNFYMMYYMNKTEFRLEDGCYRETSFVVPSYARVKVLDQPSYHLDTNWTSPLFKDMGQVGGLAHNADHTELVVFHRAGNDWSKKRWFDDTNVVLYKEAFIEQDVIVSLNPNTGEITSALGGGYFIMPHGVYLDHYDNIFVTDVALHQVYKFKKGEKEPSLILGIKLEPGSDSAHFCKPTAVAVDDDNNIYVSDGYCNSRVVKFDENGTFIGAYGSASYSKGVAGAMHIVHDITIDHEERVLYVADRENGQVHTMNYDGTYTRVYSLPGKTFALEYLPTHHTLAAVNISYVTGPSKVMLLAPHTGDITATAPKGTTLTMPHCMTYIRDVGMFVGEIAAPFTVWKLSETSHHHHPGKPLLTIFSNLSPNIPPSFIAVLAILATIPLAYVVVVVVARCRREKREFDRNGFQKLLRDYDTSEDEEDLVFKSSRVFR